MSLAPLRISALRSFLTVCWTFALLQFIIDVMRRRAGQQKPSPVCVQRPREAAVSCFGVAGDQHTCDPVQCTWVAPLAAGGICRSSALVSEGNHLWQYQSSAATDDTLRRNAGTCCLSSAWKAPCMHPNGCYSTPNRSRSHLAVRGRRRGMHTEGDTCQTSAVSSQSPRLPTRTCYN